MAVYLLGSIDIQNPELYAQYVEKTGASLAPTNAKPIILDDAAEVVEGALPGGRITGLRFESREALYDWYNSPAYRDARAIRHQSADTRFLVIVDEIDLDKISTADLIARPLAKD